MIEKYFRILLILFCAVAMTCSCIQKKVNEDSEELTALKGPYLGQQFPGTTPTVFAPNIVSTSLGERDATFSPDGTEFYYSITARSMGVILCVNKVGDHWTSPKVASFSGQYMDIEPAISPDGNRLFFASNRPAAGETDSKDFDIWYVERTDSGWSEPTNIGAPVNTDRDEFYPSVTLDGSIYFCAEYGDSEDLWRSRFENGTYLEPENLGDSVNTAAPEFNAFVAPDESYILFSSFGRDDDLGGGDLYISRNIGGNWTKARNLGRPVNSGALDYCPMVTPDGSMFFFTSRRIAAVPGKTKLTTYNDVEMLFNGIENGNDNIYWVNVDVLGIEE